MGPFSSANKQKLLMGDTGGSAATAGDIPTISYSTDGGGASSFASVGAPPMADEASAENMSSISNSSNSSMEELTSHLAQISKNTSQTPVVHGVVLLDGEQVGKFSRKSKKSDDSRSFTPNPVET